MTTLHVLSHSPFADNRLVSCLPLLAGGDALLLSGDAVYALREGTAPRRALEALAEDIALFALAEDLEARGLQAVPARLTAIDYPGFVELCCRYQRVNSWL